MLMTKWSKDIDRENPLPEYPRPQFVRDSYMSLNGMWKCCIKKNDSLPFTYTNYICVPFSPETELSGLCRTVGPDDRLFYKRKFTLEDGFNKGRVFVNFGAVDQIATVYLNGKKLGTHCGGFTPFRFELTANLTDGENELVVAVRDFTDTKEYTRGKQKIQRGGVWYSPQSGIWQSVWLESTPYKYLKSVKITPDYDGSRVGFRYEGTKDVEVLIYEGDKLIADTTEHVVELPNFRAWSPEDPFLYNVEFKAEGETIKSYFGMRKFSVGVDSNGIPRLFLNNKPYFHNGLLDQGYYPDGYLTPPSYEAMLHDIQFAKRAGFNMLRKHIKVEPLIWYHYCDVNGIIVWQDMVNGGGKYGMEVSVLPFLGIKLDDKNYNYFHRTDEEARTLYFTEMKEMINHLYNCPCIAVWTLFNEGWGQFDSENAYKMVKKLDKHRIVDTASGWHDMGTSDVISKHIYFTPIKVKMGERPYVLSEFGGLGLRIKGHTFNNKMFGYKIYKNAHTLTGAYERLYENTIIPQIKDGLSAAVYTQLTDVEDELNGLMTYDRAIEKVDINKLKKINQKVKIE